MSVETNDQVKVEPLPAQFIANAVRLGITVRPDDLFRFAPLDAEFLGAFVRVGIPTNVLARWRAGKGNPEAIEHQGYDYPIPEGIPEKAWDDLYLVRVDSGDGPWALINAAETPCVGGYAVAMIAGRTVGGLLEAQGDAVYLRMFTGDLVALRLAMWCYPSIMSAWCRYDG